MILLGGELDDAGRARFEAAYARVRAAYPQGSGTIMMALSGAERQKLWRRRQRGEVGIFPVPLRDKFGKIDWLIDCGLLDENHCDDAAAVGEAVARLIEQCQQNKP